MKTLKLAVLPMAMMATSAFAAEEVVAVETAPTAVTTTSYNTAVTSPYDPNTTVVQNTTTQVVEGTKTIVSTITHPAAVSAEIGTLGYGANVAWGVNDKTDLVVGWNGLSYDDKVELDGNDDSNLINKALNDELDGFKGDLDVKLDMNNPYVGVRLRPWANAFAVSTGVIYNDNELKAHLTPKSGSTNFSINGKEYVIPTTATKDSYVNLEVEHKNDLAPYLTLGFHPSITDKFGLFGEVGAAYAGKLKTNVTANKIYNTAGQDATADAIKQAEKELKDLDLEWMPIVKLGATYRF